MCLDKFPDLPTFHATRVACVTFLTLACKQEFLVRAQEITLKEDKISWFGFFLLVVKDI